MEQPPARFQAIGTQWHIEAYGPVAPELWRKTLQRIRGRIDEFDTAYSRFRPDSLVSRMAKKSGTYPLPSDGYKLLHFYERLYRATDGLVTPLIGQAMADAGYDAHYSLQAKALRTPPRWEDVLAYSHREITLAASALLDFGAAGKGYLVDIVSGILEDAGITAYLINAGGDMVHRNQAQLAVGLENPYDTSEAIGVVKLGNRSLCGSAGSKRQWHGYHHIIDPHSLRSPEHIGATWVLADDTMTADGLATALFFTDPVALRNEFTFSYARLHDDMSLEYSQDFPITLFEKSS